MNRNGDAQSSWKYSMLREQRRRKSSWKNSPQKMIIWKSNTSTSDALCSGDSIGLKMGRRVSNENTYPHPQVRNKLSQSTRELRLTIQPKVQMSTDSFHSPPSTTSGARKPRGVILFVVLLDTNWAEYNI